ncbi:MAG: peptide ABC transporter substrate-binding protein, partial [Cyanobacteria bacterium J06607_17]
MQKRMASLVALLAVAGCQQPVPPAPTITDSPHNDSVEDVVAAPDVLTLIYSRSPVTLNPHLASGFQDFEAARIVYEPLASYGPDGQLIP